MATKTMEKQLQLRSGLQKGPVYRINWVMKKTLVGWAILGDEKLPSYIGIKKNLIRISIN